MLALRSSDIDSTPITYHIVQIFAFGAVTCYSMATSETGIAGRSARLATGKPDESGADEGTYRGGLIETTPLFSARKGGDAVAAGNADEPRSGDRSPSDIGRR